MREKSQELGNCIVIRTERDRQERQRETKIERTCCCVCQLYQLQLCSCSYTNTPTSTVTVTTNVCSQGSHLSLPLSSGYPAGSRRLNRVFRGLSSLQVIHCCINTVTDQGSHPRQSVQSQRFHIRQLKVCRMNQKALQSRKKCTVGRLFKYTFEFYFFL